MSDMQAAEVDAHLFGTGFLVDGKRVDPSRVEVLQAGERRGDYDALCRALADVYARIPQLPVTPETIDEATDALEAFCHVLGVHGVEVG